jgi:DNA invertase Pin-like site-specific DNA recombinase
LGRNFPNGNKIMALSSFISVTDDRETLHIYTRVSTVAQAEHGTSLQSQQELGVRKAEQLGFNHKIWNEGGRSSHHEDIAQRPELNALYLAIKAGEVKHLWVYDQSRLSRNDQVASIFRYQCNKNSVTLYTKDGVFNLSSPTDKLFKQMLDGFAEFDNAMRAERSRLGKINRVRTGNWHGGPPPFGYKIEAKKLVLDEYEAEWVKKMFDEVANGKSCAQVKQMLDANAVSPRRKRGTWAIGSINKLLTNTHYGGYYKYKDKKTDETFQVQCPVIVDPTVWSYVQALRAPSVLRQPQKNATTKNFYLLRDLMYCAHCGRQHSILVFKKGMNTDKVTFEDLSDEVNTRTAKRGFGLPRRAKELKQNGDGMWGLEYISRKTDIGVSQLIDGNQRAKRLLSFEAGQFISRTIDPFESLRDTYTFVRISELMDVFRAHHIEENGESSRISYQEVGASSINEFGWLDAGRERECGIQALDKRKTQVLIDKDIVLCFRGAPDSFGKVGLYRKNPTQISIPNQSFVILRMKNSTSQQMPSPELVIAWLRSSFGQNYLKSKSISPDVVRVAPKDIAAMEIPIGPESRFDELHRKLETIEERLLEINKLKQEISMVEKKLWMP